MTCCQTTRAPRPLAALAALVLAVLSVVLATTSAPHAQDAPRAPEQAAPAPQARIDAWRAEIEGIAAGSTRDGLADRQLAELRDGAERTRSQAAALIQELSPRLAAARARLTELGQPPAAKEGEPAPPPEPEGLRAEREAQGKVAGELDGLIKQAEVIRLKAEEVLRTISDRRRARFTSTLTERTRSIVDPTLWLEAAQAMPRILGAARLLVLDWWSLILSRGGPAAIGIMALALCFAALLVIPIRRFLVGWAQRDPSAADPPLLRKAATGTAIATVNMFAPLGALLAFSFVIDSLDVAPQRIEATFRGLTLGVFLAASLWGVARALLSPGKPQWRLIPVGDDQARALMSIVLVMATLFGIGRFLEGLLDVLSAPLAAVIALSGFLAVFVAASVMAALRVVAGSLSPLPSADSAGSAAMPAVEVRSGLWRWLVPLAWIATIAIVIAALSGYVGLARFLGRQLVWAPIVLGMLSLLLVLVDEATITGFRPSTRLGMTLTRSMGFAGARVEQAGVVLSGLGRLALLAAGAFFIISPWGLDSTDILGSIENAFFGFQVGGLSISISTIFGAIAFFVIGILITRSIQGWLDQRFLPRTSLDVGLKNSIRTGIGYLGMIAAAVAAVGFAGFNLNNIAIVAGALSVGIGFGLQSIVNNFVSGLILLAERPIKAGDRVQVGAEVGYVRKINVRATEIETLDRASLIVPNSALISGNVKNWMHRDLLGQAIVVIRVTFAADPMRVRQVLLECARSHPHVLKTPPPSVFLVGFFPNAMEFQLGATVGHIDRAFSAQSDLRFEIIKRFREEGIDMPMA